MQEPLRERRYKAGGTTKKKAGVNRLSLLPEKVCRHTLRRNVPCG